MAKTLEEHYGYLSDRVKMKRYQAAIERVVGPETVVLDLGCGSGPLGLIALRAGARKVLFVEQDPIIEAARRTTADAGLADRAEFIQGNSFELSLKDRVDVVVCDHIGYFGFDYGVLVLLADARQRFLQPDGIIVPTGIDLRLAPVESEICRQLVAQWLDGSVPGEFDWLADCAANTLHPVKLGEDDLLADAAALATLQLGDEAPPYLSWSAEFRCSRDGVLDGLVGWFDCRLVDDIRMTNSPLSGEPLRRPQAYLPLKEPVTVSEGDRIRAKVMARHLDNVIAWVVEMPESNTRFDQSTFNGLLLDQEALTRAHPDRIARLNERGRARQIVLSYCDGKGSVAEVEALVRREHPDLFPSASATSSFIRQVLAWDTSE
jgi:protein arginine N-methyltransferase 1